MSVFWKYCKETLRWPLVWTAGPIALLVEGAAACLDDVRGIVLWLRNQFRPDVCENVYVASHAAARGITRQLLETGDDQFRERVTAAYAWWANGGKTGGLPELLAYFGFTTEKIVNLRDTDPERWAEFTIALEKTDGSGLTEADFPLMEWLVNDQKPARSVCAGIDMVVTISGNSPYIFMGVFLAPDVEVWPEEL
ncbi:MAG: phage tail protein [Thermodesulfobacteriota bacterium]|nr:phage tail protein [Thermodesulfobacteriota bacterium]